MWSGWCHTLTTSLHFGAMKDAIERVSSVFACKEEVYSIMTMPSNRVYPATATNRRSHRVDAGFRTAFPLSKRWEDALIRIDNMETTFPQTSHADVRQPSIPAAHRRSYAENDMKSGIWNNIRTSRFFLPIGTSFAACAIGLASGYMLF